MKEKNGLFTDLGQIRVIDSKRIAYFFMFPISFGLTELIRYVYRPFAYKLELNDFGFADSIGNSGGLIVLFFLGCSLMNPTKIQAFRLIAFYVCGLIAYEFARPYLPKGVFDVKDVIGTVVGGFIAAIAVVVLDYFIKENRVRYVFGRERTQ